VLDKTGFSGNLSSHLSTLAQFFQDVFVFTTDNENVIEPQVVQPGTAELIFCNPEKILKSLPYLISTFNALNRELAKKLLTL
jgi:hypothetical protein